MSSKAPAELEVRKLRDLNLGARASIGRPKFVSAASGIAKVGNFFYVAPDDEKHIARFDVKGKTPGALLRAVDGGLPQALVPRKKKKPDFESVCVLPAFSGFPNGAVMATGSGSGPNRQRAALWALNADGSTKGQPRLVDFSPLYKALAAKVEDLNIEGVTVVGNHLRLLQRGNESGSKNMLIDLDLKKVLGALAAGHSPTESMVTAKKTVELGTLSGVRLCLSDASALPDGRMAFSAVAEDTASSFEDGPCLGSAVGIIGTDGRVERIKTLSGYKVEGVHAELQGKLVRLTMVCDADDPKKASPLLSAVI